jgi:1-deoxy-D-xylulose-5-phosphate synthase
VHVVTQKGKGYPPAERDDLHFHGVGGFDKATGKSKAIKKMSYTSVFGETLVRLADVDKDIVAVTPAMLAGSGLVRMKEKYPERVFDVGIAEGHAGTFSAGLATSGVKPVFAVYSTFLQRAFDQMIHDVALQNLPVLVCIDRGGLVGEDGPTHHGSFDVSYLRMIPHFTVCAPRSGSELSAMMTQALEDIDHPIAIRYPRGAIPEDRPDHEYRIEWGKWEVLREGSDLVCLALGRMVDEALVAADALAERGIETGVVNCRFIKPMDTECLEMVINKYRNIVTVEENSLIGGFGAGVLEYINQHELSADRKIVRLGLPDSFIQHGATTELLRDLGLDSAGLTDVAEKMLIVKKTSTRRLTVLSSGETESTVERQEVGTREEEA